MAARQIRNKLSLRKALLYTDVSRQAWYYTPKTRTIKADPRIISRIRRIGRRRPTYGTRRMAAQIARDTHIRTSRKKVQRIYRKIGWIQPQKTKNEIIRSKRKLFKPDAPNRLWEADMTYVQCGPDG